MFELTDYAVDFTMFQVIGQMLQLFFVGFAAALERQVSHFETFFMKLSQDCRVEFCFIACYP